MARRLTKSEPIVFRLPIELMPILAEKAASEGRSVHVWCADRIVEILSERE